MLDIETRDRVRWGTFTRPEALLAGVTDLHATVLHLMGLDGRRLEVPGRKRLNMDHGRPIDGILA